MVPSRAASILPVNGSTLHPNLAASLSNAVRVNRPRDHLDRVSAIVAMRSVRVGAESGSRRARRRASVQGSPPQPGDTTNARNIPHPRDVEVRSGSGSSSLSPSSRPSPGVCSSSGHRFAATGDPQGNVAVKKIASSAVSLLCISTAAWKSATAASRSAASRSLAWDRNRIATNVRANAHTASATNHHNVSAFSRWWGRSSWMWAHPIGCAGVRAREDGTSGAAGPGKGRATASGATLLPKERLSRGERCQLDSRQFGAESVGFPRERVQHVKKGYFSPARQPSRGGARAPVRARPGRRNTDTDRWWWRRRCVPSIVRTAP